MQQPLLQTEAVASCRQAEEDLAEVRRLGRILRKLKPGASTTEIIGEPPDGIERT